MTENGLNAPPNLPEKAPKPPVYVVYRENSLYREYAPKMVASLKAQGYAVDTHAFPQGTSPEEISDWLKQNEASFSGKKFLADQTVMKQAAFDADKRNLDEAFASAAEEVLTRDIPREGDKELIVDRIPAEHTERLFTQLFKEAYEKDKPTKIYIAETTLEDHDLFGEPTEERTRPEEAAHIAKRIKKVLINAGAPAEAIEILPMRLDRIKELVIAKERKTWADRGFSEEEIEEQLEDISDEIDDRTIRQHQYVAAVLPEEIPALDQEGTWVIGDRHYIPRLEKAMSKARVIQLPLSNLIFSLVANGLVNAPTEEFEEKLATSADKTLSRVSLAAW